MTEASAPGNQPLDPAVRRGYGLGSVATGAFGTVPGLLLLPYLTDHIGVGAGIAGVIVFAPKAWDVILNPIAGAVSDRSTHRDGKRRPFLIRFGLLLAACFVLLFAGPTAPPALGAAWVAVAYLACATVYAFFQVPYVAMPAEITDDYDERTRIMTWRVVVLALAILLSGGLSPMVRNAVGPEWGYRAVGIFVGALIAFGAVAAWWGTRRAPTTSTATQGTGLADQFRILTTDRPFRLLLTGFVIQALGIAAMLAGVDYVARWVLRDPAASTLLFVGFVAPALLATPLWQRYGLRRDKKRGYLLSTAFLTAGALALALAQSLPVWGSYLCVVLVGIGYAGAQLFPMGMLPDVASATPQAAQRVGVYTGIWTAGETLGMAIGPGLYATVLAIGGYASSRAGEVATQSDGARLAVLLGFSLIPAVLFAVSVFPILRYPLTRATAPGGVR